MYGVRLYWKYVGLTVERIFFQLQLTIIISTYI